MEPEVWRGGVPLCFRLQGDARPLYVVAPRTAYLAAYETRLRRHYRDVLEPEAAPVLQNTILAESQYFAANRARPADDAASSSGDEADVLWFSDAGGPLRSDLPLGAVLDRASLKGPVKLPWDVAVRRDAAPAEHLEGGFSAFFHALKQAVHLERGTARAALGMAREHQRALWAAANAGDVGAYSEVDTAPPESPRRVPVRLLFADGPVVQLPFAGGGSLGEALGPPLRARLGGREADAVVQGCVVPWAAPLLDVWRALRAADHFLYVAVRPR